MKQEEVEVTLVGTSIGKKMGTYSMIGCVAVDIAATHALHFTVPEPLFLD